MMEVKILPVKAMVEISAPEGETLREKGTVGTPECRKALIAADSVEDWESVPVSEVETAIENERMEKEYRTEVVRRIRERYSADDEAAILRKRLALVDTDTEATEVLEEFLEYNSYAEQCKAEARSLIWPERDVSDTEAPDESEDAGD